MKKWLIFLGAMIGGCSLSFASYFLAIGTFPADEAEELHRRLADKGYPVYLLYGENYEVRLGSYDSRKKAIAAADKLKQDEKIIAQILEEESLDQFQSTWDEENSGREVDQETTQSYTDPQARKIVTLGLNLFGHPYKYGGTRIGKGIDCSFFAQTIFRELGINLPRTSGEQFRVGKKIDAAELKVGDLLFFKKTYYARKKKNGRRIGVTRINHVGIYIGSGEFIHATRNVMHVTISRLDEPYFTKRFAGARRVLEQQGN